MVLGGENLIKEINDKEFDALLESGSKGKYEPAGLFIKIAENKSGNAVYIGIDNSTGNAWTEEFNSRKTCLEWLNEA